MVLRSYFDMYQMGVGSLIFCLEDIKSQLPRLNQPNGPLEQRVDAALARCHIARALRLKWLTQDNSQSAGRGEAVVTDNAIDGTMSGINSNLGVLIRNPVDSDQRTKARELRAGLFANGVRPVTNLKYEEQHAAVAEVIGALRSPDFAPHVQACGLGVLVDQLEALNDRFGMQLDVRNSDKVEFDEVEAAEDTARDGFFRVLATILADYADQPEVMDTLLEQVHDQQERIGAYMRRRGNTPQVDPGTGEVVEPDSPAVDEDDDVEDVDTPVVDPEPAGE